MKYLSKHRFNCELMVRIKFPHKNTLGLLPLKNLSLLHSSNFRTLNWFLSPGNQPSQTGKKEGQSSNVGVLSYLLHQPPIFPLFCPGVRRSLISKPAECLIVSGCPKSAFIAFHLHGSYQLWHHQFNGHEFEQTPEDSEGQGSLVCCSPWSHKELDTTERMNNNHQLLITSRIIPTLSGGHEHSAQLYKNTTTQRHLSFGNSFQVVQYLCL